MPFKAMKANTLAREAQRAYQEGRYVFCPLLNVPSTHPGVSGSIAGWAEMIEAVEGQGFWLSHWAVGQDRAGKPEAYPVFRRGRTEWWGGVPGPKLRRAVVPRRGA